MNLGSVLLLPPHKTFWRPQPPTWSPSWAGEWGPQPGASPPGGSAGEWAVGWQWGGVLLLSWWGDTQQAGTSTARGLFSPGV